MNLSELQSMVKAAQVSDQVARIEIEDTKALLKITREELVRSRERNMELRRQATRYRSQISQMVDCISTSDEFREWVIGRVWISGASDYDMVMAYIASLPEVQS